jgi:hypothetical protein
VRTLAQRRFVEPDDQRGPGGGGTESWRQIARADTDWDLTMTRDRCAGIDRQDGWNPEKAFCLDVCGTPGGLKVAEINAINSAAFYAADMQKLVLSLDGLRR